MTRQKVFEIDGASFNDFAGFIDEFNRGYVAHVDGDWKGNLDAFNDYLCWHEERYFLRWRNSNKSQSDLGYAAMANWLKNNITQCHPSNRLSVEKRLKAAQEHQGPTLFDWLVEIIQENQEWVELILDSHGSLAGKQSK
ncbi:MAG: barnase inhibitor [Blastopirellula sp.]|nr:MAG: barnase inhibitor [Blastopirellula sp.]